MQITVIDALMGAGKTSWAIQELNNNPMENYLYITPFLAETDRIIEATSGRKHFIKPQNKGDGKLSSINLSLSNEDDIAATHELFKHLNDESREHISRSHYTLILDEVLEVISPYDLKSGDFKLLLDGKWISVDDEGFIVWNDEESAYDSTFEEVRKLALAHSLVVVNGNILLWRYSPEIFSMFDKVYILTYMFEASILKSYFDYNEIPYEKRSIRKTESGEYALCEYQPPDTSVFKPLINIYHGQLNENFT